jgi:hypothetical protein
MRINIRKKYSNIYSESHHSKISLTPEVSKFIEKFNKTIYFNQKQGWIGAAQDPAILELVYTEATYGEKYLTNLFDQNVIGEIGGGGVPASDYAFIYYKELVQNENCPPEITRKIFEEIDSHITNSFLIEQSEQSYWDFEYYKETKNSIYSSLCKKENIDSSMLLKIFINFLPNVNDMLSTYRPEHLLKCLDNNAFLKAKEAFDEFKNSTSGFHGSRIWESSDVEQILIGFIWCNGATPELVEEIFEKFYKKNFYIAKSLLNCEKLSTNSKLKIIDFFIEKYMGEVNTWRYIDAIKNYFQVSSNIPPEIIRKIWDSNIKVFRNIIPEDQALEVLFSKNSPFRVNRGKQE